MEGQGLQSSRRARGGGYLVDLRPELLRDLRLLGLHELAHHAQHVLTALRPCVGDVQIVQGDILHDLRCVCAA